MDDSHPVRPKLRWHHLTADRFLIGLLVVEVFLLLSERFCWFRFNKNPGWTVMIGVATVCLAVLLMLLWFGASLVLRRRFQFSLRALLLFVLVCAIVSSWFTVKLQQARRQGEAAEKLRKSGWVVSYDYKRNSEGEPIDPVYDPKPSGPAWLHEFLGIDFIAGVAWVFAYRGTISDENMACLSDLNSLQWLLLGETQVTDAGLRHLERLTRLKRLDLCETQVTDAGLKHLKGMTTLEELSLNKTQVTDAGLEHLKGLNNLEQLYLAETQVTDAGLEHLRGFTELEFLILYGSQVGDAGLEHLKGLTKLKYLGLEETEVTDAGLKHLKGLTKLVELHLNKPHVTDAGLEHLKGLTNLRSLDLTGTLVTDEGVQKLQQSLPECLIFHWALPVPSPTAGDKAAGDK